MQAARKVLIVCYVLAGTLCWGQSLEGTYEWVGPAALSVSHIELHKDHTFNMTSLEDFGGLDHSGGYYLVQGDTLLLFHAKIPHPDSSYYEIIAQHDSTAPLGGTPSKYCSDLAILSLKTTDLHDKPILGATVAMLSQEKTVSILDTDTLGRAYVYTQGRLVDRLNVFDISHQNLQVDLSGFWEHYTELKVRLSNNLDTYNQKEYIAKYLIEETAKGAVLRKSGSHEQFKKLPPGTPRAGPSSRTGR